MANSFQKVIRFISIESVYAVSSSFISVISPSSISKGWQVPLPLVHLIILSEFQSAKVVKNDDTDAKGDA
jgi:hypothetical protein